MQINLIKLKYKLFLTHTSSPSLPPDVYPGPKWFHTFFSENATGYLRILESSSTSDDIYKTEIH